MTNDNPSGHRVFVLGLDGATLDRIQLLLDEGKLPNFARLVAGGAHGPLTTTIPPVTAPAWSSFMTGKNPAQHGLYDFMKRRPGTYYPIPVSSRDRDAPAIWDIAGAAGRPVIVLNVPVTYPPHPVNGYMITGMLTPNNAPDAERAYPPELMQELRDQVGEYVIYPRKVYAKGRVDEFLQELYYTAGQRIKAVRYLMRHKPWDFFMVVFNETDTIQHGAWGVSDPQWHDYDPAEHEQYGNPINDYYERMDEVLGEILDELDDNTTLFIMSDHGAGPVYQFLYVNNFLERRGFMRFRRNPITLGKVLMFRLGITARTVYKFLIRIGLGGLRRSMDKRRGGYAKLRRYFVSFADVDWGRTQAYAMGYIGQVFLNVQGREPEGAVAPADYNSVREEIIAALRQLKDPKTGEPLIEDIYRKEEIYHGAYMDIAPDIVFMPRNLEAIAFGDFEFPSNTVLEPSYAISSHHRMNGIFFAYGAGVRPGLRVEDAHILDLAPTILHVMGLPVPADMDGRVLEEVLETERPVERIEAAAGAGKGAFEYSADEEEQIVDRLRSLGYIS
ncbi:MAG: alkaline phosphatase family protein [Chloroflexi bacterium]|nr:alkaline phosphatase family protein [Chloroflexota bacterium]MBU1751060.1 alkaline phosphatase family protein [Chloroflexota bacterium]